MLLQVPLPDNLTFEDRLMTGLTPKVLCTSGWYKYPDEFTLPTPHP